MTPAARLREQAAELLRLADELDAARPVDELLPLPAPAPVRREGRLVGVSAASKIAGRSVSSLYRDGSRFGFGWKLPSGGWTFDEAKLRAFMRGEVGEFGEVGDARRIAPDDDMNHLDAQR